MFAAATKTSQVSSAANYIEDVFSTYLWTGNGTTQTITNAIDLAGKGGLVWVKNRNGASTGSSVNHFLHDSARGVTYSLESDLTNGQANQTTGGVTAFNSNGFSLGDYPGYNDNGYLYAGWTFRKQPKFFDVVTWTGNGANRTIAHNLGSVPGCIMVKRTDTTGAWQVYHRSLANTEYMVLNTTAAKATGTTRWNSTTPTSTEFSLGTDATVNANSGTYVAYLFAHDAGGFGTAGTDNVISCGSCSRSRVELGWEPQWILIKEGTSTTGFWWIVDNMRGMALNTQNWLYPNASDAESSANYLNIDATGFTPSGFSPTNIYIAIRRGPMKTPTSGTSVFSPIAYAGTSSTQTQTANFPVDLFIDTQTTAASDRFVIDRLRGSSPNSSLEVETNTSNAESSLFNIGLDNSTGVNFLGGQLNGSGFNYILWAFRRAPSFMDVVCVTGTGSGATYNHNLGVVPELMFQKGRSIATSWESYTPLGKDYAGPKLDSSAAASVSSNYWTAPTSTTFKLQNSIDGNGYTYVAYLFASCPGVSKVGSYSGTGATQTISCGFAARFVMIKRTDSTGSWWVWDTARGMVSGTDPRLAMNSTAAETNANWVYTNANGFQIVTTDATVNANGGAYIFLAIA